MNRIKVILNIRILLLLVIFIISMQVSAMDSIGNEKGEVCKGSLTTYSDIVEVVKSIRSENSTLPQEESTFSLNIKKTYCHYYYIEKPERRNAPQMILMNGDGEIINWLSGHNSVISSYPCKEKKFSKSDLERFARNARAKFTNIPPFKTGTDVKIKPMNKHCLYSYTEKFNRVPNNDSSWVRYFFKFDYNGELVSLSEMDNESLLKQQSN